MQHLMFPQEGDKSTVFFQTMASQRRHSAIFTRLFEILPASNTLQISDFQTQKDRFKKKMLQTQKKL